MKVDNKTVVGFLKTLNPTYRKVGFLKTLNPSYRKVGFLKTLNPTYRKEQNSEMHLNPLPAEMFSRQFIYYDRPGRG